VSIFDACGAGGVTTVGGPSQRTFDCDDAGQTFTRTMTATDVNGNVGTCEYTVTVVSSVDLTSACQDLTVELGPDGTFTLDGTEDWTVQDACGGDAELTVTGLGPETFDCSQVGQTLPRTVTVTDADGNSTECTTNVTVVDVTPPTIECEDITVQLGPNGTYEIANDEALVSLFDACGYTGPNTVGGTNQRRFDCDDAGLTFTRTMRAVDASGNASTCTYQVTVVSSVDPASACQDLTVQLGPDGTFTLDGTEAWTVQDACGGDAALTVTGLGPETFDYDDVGTTLQRTVTVTDPDGNSTTCTTNVTIEDVTPPEIECEDITIELGPNGTYFMANNEALVSLTDNCGTTRGPFTSGGRGNREFDCDDVGQTFTRTMIARDGSNNSITCDYQVTVVGYSGDPDPCSGVRPGTPSSGAMNAQAAITAYPNPTNGLVTVDLRGYLDQPATLEVLNTFGQLIEQRRLGVIEHSTERLDLSEQPSGVYLIRLRLDDGRTDHIQLVKQQE
jgi:hypothetical protein